MSSVELILIPTFIGIVLSRTTLIERFKMFLRDTKFHFVSEGFDCSLCSSFWPAILLNGIMFTNIHDLIVNVCASSLLGYFIGKE